MFQTFTESDQVKTKPTRNNNEKKQKVTRGCWSIKIKKYPQETNNPTNVKYKVEVQRKIQQKGICVKEDPS